MRYVVAGCTIALLVYGMTLLDPAPVKKVDEPPVSVHVVPELDAKTLDGALDRTREQRLVVEADPLRHLLGKAIDVGPTVAAALGMPAKPVPITEVRANIGQWRRRWLWYEGTLEDLSGPREGHPIPGYSVYEATIRLGDGGHVLAAFSLPPDNVKVGGWVRVEGYLLKLRDTTYPQAIENAPMLVGRAIQPDYEDWPPVTALDPELLATVDDSSWWPGDKMWHTVEEDQTKALWHLAAFARDTASRRSLADWRRELVLNNELHPKLIDHEVARGTPMRVYGSLIKRDCIAAPANPAGIPFWTVAWVQVREYGGGVMIPIWVPQQVRELPDRVQLEVRGYWYRWHAYETVKNERRRVPLFVAADLDPYELRVDRTMQTIGIWLGGLACGMLGLLVWSQRRAARSSVEHSRDLDRRRRRRRAATAPLALGSERPSSG